MNTAELGKGVAFIEGRFVPIGEARISVLDWGFTRSDATYDVVHVWKGGFFRLDDHLDRFERSLRGLRLTSPYSRAEMARLAGACVVRSGLKDAYVALVCTRGRPRIPGSRRPQDCENQFFTYALPWINVIPEEVQSRGAHLFIASTPRIAPESVDPTFKNYHWGDLTRALFEAHDNGADTAVLLDRDGFVTEGPGFNVFVVRDGAVTTPDRGALEGITRRSVMELCDELGIAAAIAALRKDDLLSADEIFCATTAGGVMPASRIDGRILGEDRPGPISLRLKQAYWRRHDQGWHRTEIDYADPERPLAAAAAVPAR